MQPKLTFKQQLELAFSKKGLSYVVYRIPSMLFWAFICTGLLLFGQTIFQNNVSGDYLLNVKSVTAEEKIAVGDNLSFNFCREPRYPGILSKKNVRSFYIVDSRGNQTPVRQNILPDVAYEQVRQPCILIEIKAANIPQELGRYYFCQQITFDAWGHDKVANFCSSEWQVVPVDN
jgi:hypothetical protein